jgi:hypothetical protein
MKLTTSFASRLTSLRLEYDHSGHACGNITTGISSLLFLEQLYFGNFVVLGSRPAEVAVTLRPLHRLRALVGDRWS